jgi:ATP synthase protein I
MGLGWVLAVSLLVGTFGGVFLDRWLGSTPWLTLLGIALGMAAGLTSVLRTALALDRKSNRRGEED